MKTSDRLKNVIAFLSILFGENQEFLNWLSNKPPKYIIEKYFRYIQTEHPAWEWGMHHSLRRKVFDSYFDKYASEILRLDEGLDKL